MVFDRRNGIYRSLVIAAFGLTLIGAAPESSGEGQGNQSATQSRAGDNLNRIAAALEKLPQRPAPDTGCDAGHEDRKSDLCAQWKAADAAAESAWWTAATFFAGMAGIVIGGVTLVFAGKAAHWAKEAATETKRSADAADNALIEAGKTNETHLRPWLQVEIINKPRMAIVKGAPRIPLRIRVTNKGNSPAVGISYIPNLCIGYKPDIQLSMDFSYLRKEVFALERSLFQGESDTFDAWVEHHGDPVTVSDAYLTVSVFYKTTFSDEWRTTAVFYQIYDKRMDGSRMIDFSESLPIADFVMTPWEEMPGLIE